MKTPIVKVIRYLISKFIQKRYIEQLIIFLSQLAEINLLILAYQKIGILKYQNSTLSGEDFVINSVLKTYLKNETLTMLDVGAHVGDYSKKLRDAFPNASLYAFEPNPNTFELLKSNLSQLHVNCYQYGLSSKSSQQKIYTYHDDKYSQHTSVYRDVLVDLHKANEVIEIEFNNITLDEFCIKNKIDYINFLKIDTEGHEMDVFQGGKQMVSQKRIGIIQFEFNEMNIISRVFLKDFYEILYDQYEIYRVNSDTLIPLKSYNSNNEIFKFQNILAINREMTNFI